MLEHLVTRGYAPGGGLISPEGVFYLNIPKNASTYLTNLLAASGWEHSLVTNPNIVKSIVVVRDPVDRWISGFSTYAASWLLSAGYGSDHFREDYNDLTERIIFDQIIFDDHTTEQVKYVEQIDKSIPITYFTLNHGLGMQLESYLDCKLGLNNPIPANIGEDNYDTKMIAKHIRYRIDQNPVLKAKVIDRYSADYALIKSADYYYEPR